MKIGSRTAWWKTATKWLGDLLGAKSGSVSAFNIHGRRRFAVESLEQRTYLAGDAFHHVEDLAPTDIGVHRGRSFFLDNGDQQWEGAAGNDLLSNFGVAGDKPLVGDWNNDGRDEIGIHRGSEFFLDGNGNGRWDGVSAGDLHFNFGSTTDTPLVGDWNNDGKDDIGVHRGNHFYLDGNGNGRWDGVAGGDVIHRFGSDGDTPVIGDCNGDHLDDIGIHRGNQFYLDANGDGRWNGVAGGDQWHRFGIIGDIPIVGNFSGGDVADQIGVKRGRGFFLDNGDGRWRGADDQFIQFGNDADAPLIGHFVQSASPVGFFAFAVNPRTAAARSANKTEVNLNFDSVTSTNSIGDGIQLGDVSGTVNIGNTTITDANGNAITINNVQDAGAGTDLTVNFGTTTADGNNGIVLTDNDDSDTGDVVVTFDNLDVNADNGVGLLVDDNDDGTHGGTNFTFNPLGNAPNITANNGAAINITGGNGLANGANGWVFNDVTSTNSVNQGIVLADLNNPFTIQGTTDIDNSVGDAISIQNTGSDIVLDFVDIDGGGADGIDVSGFTGTLSVSGTIDSVAGNAININNGASNGNFMIIGVTITFAATANGQTGVNVNNGDGMVIVAGVIVDLNNTTGSTGIFVEGDGSSDGLNLGNGVSASNITLNLGAGSVNFNFNNGTNITGDIEVDGITFSP